MRELLRASGEGRRADCSVAQQCRRPPRTLPLAAKILPRHPVYTRAQRWVPCSVSGIVPCDVNDVIWQRVP